jgi:hypothetical protein
MLSILYKMEEAIKGEIVHEEKHEVAPSHHAPQKKSKKGLFIIIGVVLAIVVLVGGYFFITSRNASTADEETASDSEVVETLSAEELGLSIEAKPDGKAVKFIIEKAGDIKNIEYQLTYEADSTAQERSEGGEDRVQRGVTGEATISGGKTKYESEWLDLGSCSRNVCKYDSGVKSVDLTLKLVKKSGKTYEAQTSQPLGE